MLGLLREYWEKNLTFSAVVFWVQRRTSSAWGNGRWCPSPCMYSDRISRYMSPGIKFHSCSSRINVFIEKLQFYKYWYHGNTHHSPQLGTPVGTPMWSLQYPTMKPSNLKISNCTCIIIWTAAKCLRTKTGYVTSIISHMSWQTSKVITGSEECFFASFPFNYPSILRTPLMYDIDHFSDRIGSLKIQGHYACASVTSMHYVGIYKDYLQCSSTAVIFQS